MSDRETRPGGAEDAGAAGDLADAAGAVGASGGAAGAGEGLQATLRALPAVDRLAGDLIAFVAREAETPNGMTRNAPSEKGTPEVVRTREGAPLTRSEAVSAARAVLAERRSELLDGAKDDPSLLRRARSRLRPSLRRVLNGTGVVIHTNLGRSPLPRSAVEAVRKAAAGYSNLELSLEDGLRGARCEHVSSLLVELTGCEDALVVNNGAGAALLAIAALGSQAGVAVSRGQLVEIGGGFRVPDVLRQAGVPLIEVGTTNRTRRSDYERALSEGAGTILRVHQSNFRTVGFVEEVEIEALCSLGVPVIDDLGSGALRPVHDEPPVRRSVDAGASLVCFSGDKLLGGPQAGILLGAADAISSCMRHPLARALRIGRLPLAALEATLSLYRDPERAAREVPTLAMLTAEPAELDSRARRLAQACEGEVVDSVARVGGGALPLLELRGPAVVVGGQALAPAAIDPRALAHALRTGDPPLIPRIADGVVLVDPRTLAEEEVDLAARAIQAALAAVRPAA